MFRCCTEGYGLKRKYWWYVDSWAGWFCMSFLTLVILLFYDLYNSLSLAMGHIISPKGIVPGLLYGWRWQYIQGVRKLGNLIKEVENKVHLEDLLNSKSWIAFCTSPYSGSISQENGKILSRWYCQKLFPKQLFLLSWSWVYLMASRPPFRPKATALLELICWRLAGCSTPVLPCLHFHSFFLFLTPGSKKITYFQEVKIAELMMLYPLWFFCTPWNKGKAQSCDPTLIVNTGVFRFPQTWFVLKTVTLSKELPTKIK